MALKCSPISNETAAVFMYFRAEHEPSKTTRRSKNILGETGFFISEIQRLAVKVTILNPF